MSPVSPTVPSPASAPTADGPTPRLWPELLAPAGDWTCARAAVENGADAIYFGLDRFNARMRADNFTEADLPGLMRFLHGRGVRGYVAFNTLVFEEELPEAERFLRRCIEAGVDAAIVQDVGICRLIRRLSPDFPIHASTQMTITSAAGVELARELGCHLVVLARECSVADIERLQGELPAGAALPLELFVHGALCVAYSGQCLTSESLGGRSANRGECAQACRLPYELVADGRTVPLGARRHLLSPQDLLGLELLPRLIRLGIASLKIEGRLKSPEYVANVTRAYREALDHLADARARGRLPERLDAAPWRYGLEMAFSRGLHTGWLEGIDNQRLVHAEFGKKRGVLLGRVLAVERGRVRVRLEGPLKPGDGVVFEHPEGDTEHEEGGRVYAIEPLPDGAHRLAFGHGRLRLERIRPGCRFWKTSDPELERQWRQSFASERPRFRRPVIARVSGRAGQPLRLELVDEAGRRVEVASAMPLAEAHNRPLDTAVLEAQLGRLGDTPFRLERIDNRLEGPVILPLGELNRLRREAAARLEALRSEPPRWTLHDAPALPPATTAEPDPDPGPAPLPAPQLAVLVRQPDQLDAALEAGAPLVYLDWENLRALPTAVARFRERAGADPGRRVFVAPPRITKPGEDWMLAQVEKAGADGILARNWDHLRRWAGRRPLIGDFSLNAANHLAVQWFRERFGLERVTASYDLNDRQLEALLQAGPAPAIEVVIHQHMPMFHMEHCVFCAFLSTGKDYRDCGRPCEKHRVGLRDRVGAVHPVLADAGCRNTVFNALAQTGAEYVTRLAELGVRWFRIEFLDEPADRVRRTIDRYQALLRGEITGRQLWRELKLRHQLGVTRGTLDRGRRPLTVL
ncbi:MAG: U32 family peptidase [Verrucomicrobia bacterium]|nr:MAG: U32 family peptidase [Verrucomicrobiota bacterium]